MALTQLFSRIKEEEFEEDLLDSYSTPGKVSVTSGSAQLLFSHRELLLYTLLYYNQCVAHILVAKCT